MPKDGSSKNPKTLTGIETLGVGIAFDDFGVVPKTPKPLQGLKQEYVRQAVERQLFQKPQNPYRD